MPVLQRARYFSRSRKGYGSAVESHVCLQSAMWTLASSMSSQFQHLRQSLYHETMQRLSQAAHVYGNDETAPRLELAQAWILVAVYEFMHDTFQRAWSSTGRAIRLVQLLRLNGVDSVGHDADAADFIKNEEKRRTFWVAFCLDRFSCALKGLHVTLTEEPVCPCVSIVSIVSYFLCIPGTELGQCIQSYYLIYLTKIFICRF